MKWMNLPAEYSSSEAYYYIVPIEYESEATYKAGSKKGWEAIIKASKQLEYYDEQYDKQPYQLGIHTRKPIIPQHKSKKAIEEIAQNISNITAFPIILGGDHSITIGCVKGLEKTKEFDIIVLDAHTDYRYSWQNDQYNHACVNRRLVNEHKILVIGARSMDKAELEQIKENENIDLIQAHNIKETIIRQKLKQLKKQVYLSIDVDVLDPSIIRNTGTPEPMGLNFRELLKILEVIFETKEVIATDLVEFIPANEHVESYSLSRLIYKIMCLKKLK